MLRLTLLFTLAVTFSHAFTCPATFVGRKAASIGMSAIAHAPSATDLQIR
jgi:hypothetical protein